MDLKKFSLLASQHYVKHKKAIKRLKKLRVKNLDELAQQHHDEAFQQIDCLSCANCCKTTSPAFYQKDIERLAKALRMKPGAFIAAYLQLDADGDYVLNQAPCPFLLEDNYCGVYEHRPKACREYPHTDRKNFHQILDLTLKNTTICPAAYKVVERLEEELKL